MEELKEGQEGTFMVDAEIVSACSTTLSGTRQALSLTNQLSCWELREPAKNVVHYYQPPPIPRYSRNFHVFAVSKNSEISPWLPLWSPKVTYVQIPLTETSKSHLPRCAKPTFTPKCPTTVRSDSTSPRGKQLAKLQAPRFQF